MARLLALCSLPRTNPKTRLQYVRRNGPYTLYVTVSAGAKLPFGNLPRLLLAWVCSEAVRTQRRELVLGRSLYEFMRKLGLEDRSGGANAERTRLKNQMRRLFGCTVTLVYEDEERESRVSSLVADRADYWWNAKRPAAPVLWDSTIELGEKFFQEIIAHPVPLDLHTLKPLKRSPLGLDLYFWLVYRVFSLKAPLTLSWKQLYRQFGAEPDRASKVAQQAFRRDCLRELKKIKRAWADLNYHTVTGGLVVSRRCCANRHGPARCPPTGSSPADAIRHWSAEGGHPIQDLAAEDGLTPLPSWTPDAKGIADDGLVAE